MEKLYSRFEVPSSLQAKLLLPYLSNKAKSLLLRLEQSRQDVYIEVKKFLLNEFKLTPIQFKGKFERAVRNNEESFTMYCSRLTNLLTYYVRSREVNEKYDAFFSLLVADRIKATLPETYLNRILRSKVIRGKNVTSWQTLLIHILLIIHMMADKNLEVLVMVVSK